MLFKLIITGVMLGVGLAMDAFSVSLANGLNEPTMKRRKLMGIAGVFAYRAGGARTVRHQCVFGRICGHSYAEKCKTRGYRRCE